VRGRERFGAEVLASQKWEKLGRVYVAGGEQPWAQSHAFLPTPVLFEDQRIRVYVAFLDAARIGRVGWVDVDARDPRRVLSVSRRPVLDVGVRGTFDESGVTPTCVVRQRNRLHLYYTGWQLGTQVRYWLFSGLASSDDAGETFSRVTQAPLLDRSDGEIYVRTAAFVLRDAGRWKMWYAGGDRWIVAGGKEMPSYSLRYLESRDPSRWGRHGRVCLEPSREHEFGFGRPWVVRHDQALGMWYSIRSSDKGYRLGYAESVDGLDWRRRDGDLGLDTSPSGWDSSMLCYSAVLPTRFGTYLFYNGNNYGESGFGVAVRG
jgi:hypothetical protein